LDFELEGTLEAAYSNDKLLYNKGEAKEGNEHQQYNERISQRRQGTQAVQ
jgi:hypothetical protein